MDNKQELTSLLEKENIKLKDLIDELERYHKRIERISKIQEQISANINVNISDNNNILEQVNFLLEEVNTSVFNNSNINLGEKMALDNYNLASQLSFKDNIIKTLNSIFSLNDNSSIKKDLFKACIKLIRNYITDSEEAKEITNYLINNEVNKELVSIIGLSKEELINKKEELTANISNNRVSDNINENKMSVILGTVTTRINELNLEIEKTKQNISDLSNKINSVVDNMDSETTNYQVIENNNDSLYSFIPIRSIKGITKDIYDMTQDAIFKKKVSNIVHKMGEVKQASIEAVSSVDLIDDSLGGQIK